MAIGGLASVPVEYLIFFLGAVVPVYIVFGAIGLSGLRTLTRYEVHDSFYYRLNPGTKVVALFLVALSISSVGLDLGLLATGVILGSYVTLFHGKEKLALGTLFTIAAVWGTVWGSVSDRLSFILGQESAGHQVNASFFFGDLTRTVASDVAVSGVFLMALILVMTSTPSDVMRVLRKIGLPNPITFSVVVGMRTVPILLEAINSIMKVQLMRGFGSRGSRTLGPLYVFAASILALIPALIYLLRGARNMAISTGTRAFGAFKNRTYVKKPPFGPIDVAVLTIAAAFLAISILS